MQERKRRSVRNKEREGRTAILGVKKLMQQKIGIRAIFVFDTLVRK